MFDAVHLSEQLWFSSREVVRGQTADTYFIDFCWPCKSSFISMCTAHWLVYVFIVDNLLQHTLFIVLVLRL